MGDCCSSDATVVVDPSAMPEKQNDQNRSSEPSSVAGNNDMNVESESGRVVSGDNINKEEYDASSFLIEARSDSIPKTRKLDIEQEWRIAIQNSDNKKIRQLFKAHYKQINFLKIKFDNGDKSLHNAVRQNNVRLATFLILLKTPINAINEVNGNTALHYAVLSDSPEMVQLLIKKDECDINIANKDGQYPLDIATERNQDIIVELLQKEHEVETESKTTKGIGGESVSLSQNSVGRKKVTHQGDTPLFGYGSDTGDDNDENVKYDTSDSQNSPRDQDSKGKRVSMQGFLDKKRLKGRFNYQKRWVIASEPYILWNEEESQIEDVNNKEMRDKFEGCIDMSTIQSVVAKKSKQKTKQTKFIVTTKDASQQDTIEHAFRCESEQDRNKWVRGLTKSLRAIHANDNKN